MRKNRIVMKDIALAAGVHQTTVSMALRNDPRIKKETREKIQKLAKDMGYSPDPVLQSLVSYRRSSKSNPYKETIALVYDINRDSPIWKSYYITMIRKVILERASELGYKVELFLKGTDYTHSKMLDRILKNRGIHAILFGAVVNDSETFELDWDCYSVVKVSQSPIALEADSIMTNYFFSVRRVMRRLKELGYERPAMAGSNMDELNTRNLFSAGFLYGQDKHFAKENHIPYYEFERRGNIEINNEIYRWLKVVKPDVLLSYWGNLVEPAYRLTTKDGHNCRFVPVEGDALTSQLGGVLNNYQKVAEKAVDLLTGKIQNHDRGLPYSASVTLVEAKWNELTDWPPKEPLLGSLIAESKHPTQPFNL